MEALTVYARTSTRKQSPESQIYAARDFAKRTGFEVGGVFIDAAVSGTTSYQHRPGFVAMLEYLSGLDTALVYVRDLDRLSRGGRVDLRATVRAIGWPVIAEMDGWTSEPDLTVDLAARDPEFAEWAADRRRLVEELASLFGAAT